MVFACTFLAPTLSNVLALAIPALTGDPYNSKVFRTRKRNRVRKRIFTSSAAVTDVPVTSVTPFNSLKSKLLISISGLDRGLVANESDLINVESVAKELEDSSGIVDLSLDVGKLGGSWRLVYSSAFASGSLGGLRPGPPTGRLPLTLGQVFQRIDTITNDFDNVVNLRIGTPWPFPEIEVTATLAHRFEVLGRANVRIIYERTNVQLSGNLSQVVPFPIELPQLPEPLRPPSNIRSGDFEVTFVDKDLRITRGDRGELRVFLKS
eukprot:TRINITY_DN13350_c0_g1_i1.p1 TRINITY_DN13350_c0_g1~~TRINITY_DN13350_c0_g1_i1.p1  ORF type:complete len:265 (-),score=40.23 TRINITY_DN13350_c0_g1_i1:341-1135(-)